MTVHVIRASASHRQRISQSYVAKVLATDPIAYWPLDEQPGASVAACRILDAQKGAYDSTPLGKPGIGAIFMKFGRAPTTLIIFIVFCFRQDRNN